MLPIYKATAIQKAPLVGGSTQPCLLLATAYNGKPVGSYVVKIFKQRNLEQINGTAKEVYANVLAQHFDLAVPSAALIEVEYWLINALKKLPEYANWDITEGVYFGTKYIKGGIDYSETLPYAINIWEKENIFAYDALIRNVDRTTRKTNLFLTHDTIYLIDHELTLYITNTFETYLQQKDWGFLITNPKGGHHLFFNDLCDFNKKEAITFDQFGDNLRTLKPETLLRKEAEQLEEYGISTADYHSIEKYLKAAVQNVPLFLENLKTLLA